MSIHTYVRKVRDDGLLATPRDGSPPLEQQVRTQFPAKPFHVHTDKADMVFDFYEADLAPPQVTTLNGIYTAWDPNPSLLGKVKRRRYAEIDSRTDELILEGFSYDSRNFPMTMKHRLRYMSLSVLGLLATPQPLETKNNNTYNLTAPNLAAFLAAFQAAWWGHIESGRALKKQIFDAADIASVNAIVDNR